MTGSSTERRTPDFNAIAALVLIAVLMPSQAFAYVDPSTGGVLVQLVTAGAAGLAVLARLYWRRLRSVFSPRSRASAPESLGPPPPPAAREK